MLATAAKGFGSGHVSQAIPLLLHVFSTFDAGGAQSRFVSVANHFGRALRHVVVAMDGKYGEAVRLSPAVDATLPPILVQKGRTFGNRRRFRAALKAIHPDVLITHNWGTLEWPMANWPAVTRHVHIEDGFGADEIEHQFLRRVLARRVLLTRSIVVVPSNALLKIAREIWRIPERRLRFIPNGIDWRLYGHADVHRIPGREFDGLVIGTVAALRPEKNLARLIRVFASIARETRSRLVIVGDGRERAVLESLAAELGVGSLVDFIGHVPDPSGFYLSFDVFALTSDTEQMPFTVLEAMAAARPIVSTNVGDIGRMVSNSNRPYLVPKDEAAIAQALRRLLCDAQLRGEIGLANMERARNVYDQRSMFNAYAELYGVTALKPATDHAGEGTSTRSALA